VKRIASKLKGTSGLIAYLRSRRFACLLLFVIVVAAGPLGIDLVVLIDLITLVGVDVFILSLLYYFSDSSLAWFSPVVYRCRALLSREGAVWPSRECWESPASLALCLGHNLCFLVTPTRYAGFALLCLLVLPLSSMLGVSHVA
jgi:hypothetical protein